MHAGKSEYEGVDPARDATPPPSHESRIHAFPHVDLHHCESLTLHQFFFQNSSPCRAGRSDTTPPGNSPLSCSEHGDLVMVR